MKIFNLKHYIKSLGYTYNDIVMIRLERDKKDWNKNYTEHTIPAAIDLINRDPYSYSRISLYLKDGHVISMSPNFMDRLRGFINKLRK